MDRISHPIHYDLIEPASVGPVAWRWRYPGWRRPPAQPYLWRTLRGPRIPWVRAVPLHTTHDGRRCCNHNGGGRLYQATFASNQNPIRLCRLHSDIIASLVTATV